MHDRRIEQSPAAETPGEARLHADRSSEPDARVPPRRERHTVRLVLGLAGLLGVAWAVAIVSRYPNLLAG